MSPDTPKLVFTFPEQQPKGMVLAFDFGTQWIGLAIGQAFTGSARPLPRIRVTQDETYWRTIRAVIQEWQPKTLVVGLPIHMNDAIQPITHAAKRFATELEDRFKIPVYLADERLTSLQAEQEIAESDDKIRKKQSIDSIAAQIMLESWLQHWQRV